MKRLANLAFVLCFALFLAAVLLVTARRVGTVSYSAFENRALAGVPERSVESVLSGGWFSGWEDYFLDRAAGRDRLLALRTRLCLMLRQPVVNTIVPAGDRLLPFYDYDAWDGVDVERESAAAADDLDALRRYVAENGGTLVYVGVPAQAAYYAGDYPAYLEHGQNYFPALDSVWRSALDERGVPYVDMTAVYAELGFPAGYYFTTDHHQTIRGALLTCQKLIETVNEVSGFALEAPREEALSFVTLPNPMLGSRNRMLYGLYPTQERLTYAEPPVPFTRFDNGAEVPAALTALPRTSEEAVSYSVFMGGDVGETILRTDRPELPNALLVGESYTNAVETLLYASFNETRSLDLRYYTEQSLWDYIASYQPDVVVILRDEAHFIDNDADALFR